MLEKSTSALRNGYTIYISKRKGAHGLSGSFQKKDQAGLHPYELPEKELRPLIHFANIVEKLEDGNLLQVHQDGFLIKGIIGPIKTEGPYCEKEYFEVVQEYSASDYHEMLVDLDFKLADQKTETASIAVQYTKLYKGVNERYE